MKYIAGIDVGGTTVKIGLFDGEGALLEKWAIPTRTDGGGEQILPDTADSLREHLEKAGASLSDLTGAGIGVPGAVMRDGTVNRCVNLGWGVFSLTEALSSLLCGIPVFAGNDANVAALGEQWKGGGKGCRSIVMVTLGTGVGGGVVIDGNILIGAHGAAGEIGHIQMREDEPETCGCGKHGCLEQYASARGIARVTKLYLKEHPEKESSLRSADHISARVLFDEAKKGDATALEIVEIVCGYLGRGLAAVAEVVDPEAFVIGGGVSNAGTILTDTIQKYYVQSVFHASRGTKFVLAELGNDAGIYGAARLVLNG
ncbi:MAG: ROK family glucokinase [Lachnospiraceae bacterium]|jgi:glucokinase|nr:ROK family glucokinase [Lachnospiraceae bacterium]MCI1327872.1 ROK family glucokinase [Lachnospiraceae bacterium]